MGIGDAIFIVVLATLFAMVVEAITENILRVFPQKWLNFGKSMQFQPPYIVALVVGVMICFLFKFGIFVLLIQYLNVMLGITIAAPPPWADFIITGILLSRGGNWIHDWLGGLVGNVKVLASPLGVLESTSKVVLKGTPTYAPGDDTDQE